MVKPKTPSLNALFTRWEAAIPEYQGKLIRDGIIDEEKFESPELKYKILFVMKEANNPKGTSEDDFRSWWKEEMKYTFSKRIAEWSYGILNAFPAYDDFKNDRSALENVLQSIALMNVKKSGGTVVSNYKEIERHVNLHLQLLHEQLDIINPDIVILGLSWKEIPEMLFPDMSWVETGYDIRAGRWKNARVIDFYHPSSRNAPAAAYCLLEKIIKASAFQRL